ncbi:reverse transcriptase [Gossypium australe]|uniref:Reverse transcriptase n=1 Tax=Gossypium australe TaxID=47621 RepID=A0A5B6WJ56_9ROSI|nr:reverse transcriptase [Gossypium australe]
MDINITYRMRSALDQDDYFEIGESSTKSGPIDQLWKGKKYFEVIHLDDYDYVLILIFLDKINALLVSFEDCMFILDTRQQQCVVLVSRYMKCGTKILSAI